MIKEGYDLTIIIPHCDIPGYLNRLLKTIVAEAAPENVECIVVDDRSKEQEKLSLLKKLNTKLDTVIYEWYGYKQEILINL